VGAPVGYMVWPIVVGTLHADHGEPSPGAALLRFVFSFDDGPDAIGVDRLIVSGRLGRQWRDHLKAMAADRKATGWSELELTRWSNIISVTRRTKIILASAVAACLAIAAGTVAVISKIQRDREWLHGGDTLTTRVDVRAVAPQEWPAAVSALGGPRDAPELMGRSTQAVVVRVDWTGSARDGGYYDLIALDGRVRPPLPLRLYEGWGTRGNLTGSGWAGAYEALAAHYDWLAGTAMVRAQGGWTSTAASIDAPAASAGSLAASYFLPDDGLPFPAGGAGVLVSLFYVDSRGEVRWAKRVTG
jgi:hypothetical protein